MPIDSKSKIQPEPDPFFDCDSFLPAFGKRAHALGFQPWHITSIDNDPIVFWERESEHPDSLAIFISTGIHGDEPSGPPALLRFLDRLGNDRTHTWVLAPSINPSGLRLGTRENASGIDLNRDFLRKQSAECQAITGWWDKFTGKIDVHLSLHEDWESAGFYFYAINTGTLPCFAELLREQLERHLPLESSDQVDGHLLAKPGLITHESIPDEPEGWPEAIWLCRRFPLISYTFEAPGTLPLNQRLEGLSQALELCLPFLGEMRRV